MKRRASRPQPPRAAKPSTVSRHRPPRGRKTPRPPSRPDVPQPALRVPKTKPHPRQIARIIDEEDGSLLDVVDNLLTRGVMLNADLILALADVDLVYVRLSALLCAADRVLPAPRARR